MFFTREPIIESVIVAKSGFVLALRPANVAGRSEHIVDSVEVVSFGNGFFYRPTGDASVAFLLPAASYEVVETKEPRQVLKSAIPDRKNDSSNQESGGKKKRPRTRTKKRDESPRDDSEQPVEKSEEKGDEASSDNKPEEEKKGAKKGRRSRDRKAKPKEDKKSVEDAPSDQALSEASAGEKVFAILPPPPIRPKSQESDKQALQSSDESE